MENSTLSTEESIGTWNCVQAWVHGPGESEDRLRVIAEGGQQCGRADQFVRRNQQQVPAGCFGHFEIRQIEPPTARPPSACVRVSCCPVLVGARTVAARRHPVRRGYVMCTIVSR